QLVALGKLGRRLQHGDAEGASGVVDLAHGGIAQPALRNIHDTREGEVVGRLADHAEIGHRVAEFLPLVEARAADDAVVEAERDETVLELAHLEGGADQDRHVVERMALALQRLDLLADGAGLLFRVPGGVDHHPGVVGVGGVGEERLAQPPLIVGDEVGGRAQYVGRGAVVALEPYDLRARKILLEAQDVVHLRAAPAIDRLVVVADAANIYLLRFVFARGRARAAPAGLRGGARNVGRAAVAAAAFGRGVRRRRLANLPRCPAGIFTRGFGKVAPRVAPLCPVGHLPRGDRPAARLAFSLRPLRDQPQPEVLGGVGILIL